MPRFISGNGKGNWDDHLPLIEFAYNCYHSSNVVALCDDLYGRRCRSPKDVRRRDIEFDVDDWVYLKISHMNGAMRFGEKGKFSPHYVGPYHILRNIGKVSYELEFSSDLASIHTVFHVSLLKKCVGDPMSIVPLEGLGVEKNISYEEVPIEILGHQIRKLRNEQVASMKVIWRNQLVEGATWETEANMMSRYPHFFP
ncbi:hypothetical protein MTR67_039415 [Solanum verrucosum]|uniref:Tf2-1-like SH3-like domain-containing protein n=1 Tax=Solanum verrucosum TaxID=315347 RepID=A0AAF0UGV2_SOLVR|nr:hypothetical protein MTR67_039415 [Solanum verrucosum]